MDAVIGTLTGAFIGGLLTSASPCALAAVPVAIGYVGGSAASPARAWALSAAFVGGLTLVLVLLGLLSARLGLLMGALPGSWTIGVGVVVATAGFWLWRLRPGSGWQPPESLQRRMARAGLGGAFVLGALVSTAMSPCATPALAMAIAIAGSGAAFGESMWWGGALLLAYGLGHGLLLFIAGAVPSAAQSLIARVHHFEPWLPGRRFFSAVLLLTGAWWVVQGLGSLR